MTTEFKAEKIGFHHWGTKYDASKKLPAFMKEAGLDWEVKPHKLSFVGDDGKRHEVKERVAMVREPDNRVMTISSPEWKPWQNTDMIKFMLTFDQAGAPLEVAGKFRDGMVVWGLARLKRSFEVRKGDRVNGFLLLTTSHIVGRANTVQTMTVRQICTNGMVRRDMVSNYSQNHMKEFSIENAQERILAADEHMALAEKTAKKLDKLKISTDDAIRHVLVPAFVPSLLDDKEAMKAVVNDDGMPSVIKAIMASYEHAPGALPGTGWGVLNAVTHWADHVGGRSPQTRAYRGWLGDRARKKTEVERLLLEMME